MLSCGMSLNPQRSCGPGGANAPEAGAAQLPRQHVMGAGTGPGSGRALAAGAAAATADRAGAGRVRQAVRRADGGRGLLPAGRGWHGLERPPTGFAIVWPATALIMWAAIRLGVGGTSLALVIFAGTILASALAGRGPFALSAANADVVSLQVFLITVSIPLLLLAALVEERIGTEQALKQSEARMRVAAASTDTGLWQYDFATHQLWATEHCRSMFGYAPDATLSPDLLLAAVVPEDRAIASAAMRAATFAGGAAANFASGIRAAKSAGIWQPATPNLTRRRWRFA